MGRVIMNCLGCLVSFLHSFDARLAPAGQPCTFSGRFSWMQEDSGLFVYRNKLCAKSARQIQCVEARVEL